MAAFSAPRFTPRAVARGDLSLRARRPPGEYVSLLSQSEQEFRSYINSLETDAGFQKLVQDGTLVKVRLQGRIPREKYEAFMDRQLVEFLREYKIEETDGWERDFLAPRAIDRADEIAGKYNVPVGLLLRFLRYLRSANSEHLPQRLNSSVSAEAPPQIEDSVAGSDSIDLSETIEQTREFVERYEVSEQDFLDQILSGDATAEQLAQKFGCSLREAEEVLEAAEKVYLAENWDESTPSASNYKNLAPASETVAFVQVVDGQLSVQFQHDSVYTQRYHIRVEDGGDKLAQEAVARDLLLRARYVNQRLSALSRLVQAACNYQIEYLESGDARRLKPLAQAELARQLGEHPSTVSRLIRGKEITTPHGSLPLTFLCQGKTDVVARLVAAFPQLTDQEVVSKLREDFDCQIARRTVAYHRGKRLRRNKRRKIATDEENARRG